MKKWFYFGDCLNQKIFTKPFIRLKKQDISTSIYNLCWQCLQNTRNINYNHIKQLCRQRETSLRKIIQSNCSIAFWSITQQLKLFLHMIFHVIITRRILGKFNSGKSHNKVSWKCKTKNKQTKKKKHTHTHTSLVYFAIWDHSNCPKSKTRHIFRLFDLFFAGFLKTRELPDN